MSRRSIAEIRREEIVKAFYKVVSEQGFSRATIREIAKAAGCSYRMLHHYFSDKDEIVETFVDHVSRTYLAELREGVSNELTAGERVEFLNSYFSDLSRFTLDFCRAWVECWALGNSRPVVSEALNRCYNEARTIITDIIRDGMRSGEFRKVDPHIAANLILATYEGMTMLWVVNTENTPVESINEHVPEFCLSYLKKPT